MSNLQSTTHSKTLEVLEDGDKSIFIFEHPRDVSGTAVLTFTHKHGPDDQWLYLPALKRVKRISSDNKSGSFVGSEFAYEDLSSQEVEKYTYKWIQDAPCPGKEEITCFNSEDYPVDKSSGYIISTCGGLLSHVRNNKNINNFNINIDFMLFILFIIMNSSYFS